MSLGEWRQRWEQGNIGFHLGEINPLLRRYVDRLRIPRGGRILVPFCGKTHDLVFLAREGLDVHGAECVPQAAREFHREQGIAAEPVREGAFEVWRSPGITFWCGDFFDLEPDAAGGAFDAIWDRAALIALPEADRPRYVAHLFRFLRPGGRILLVTLSYDPARMKGPPWSVDEAEVRALFHSAPLTVLKAKDVLETNPKFKERGLDRLVETTWLIGADA